MKKFKYQDFLNQLALGTEHGVFIDDTGSPGLKSNSSKLNPARKSWVTVIIPPFQIAEVLSELPRAIEGLGELTGAAEFHFTDIYQGRKQFEGVDLPRRLSIFKFMAYIFEQYKFPILVQTFDPVNLNDLKDRGMNFDKLKGFDLSKPNDAALLFLLINVKRYLESRNERAIARVFVDEGFKKNGVAIHLPTFSSVFADGLVCFGNSASIMPLQMADFAAFVMNRQQILLAREVISDLDKSFLEIIQSVNLNFQNISVQKIKFTKRDEGWERN